MMNKNIELHKKIKLKHFTKPDLNSIYTNARKYRVHYDHGKFAHFTSQADCKRFLREFGNFLTEQLYAVNLIQAELYSYFKKYYAHMPHQAALKIRDCINRNDDIHYRLLFRESQLLGNSDKVVSMYKTIGNLKDICNIFKNIFEEQQRLLHWEMNRIIEQLNQTKERIEKFGDEQ